MTDTKPNLFQYWNTPHPPADVIGLMDSWAEDPNFVYRRFNQDTADKYIEQHFDARTLAAFRKCAVPAMQADFFRYCALYQEGGVYVDADTANSGKLADFIKDDEYGVLMMRQEKVANDFIFVREAKTNLLKQTLQGAVENVENEISNNVWMVTGPGVMTKFYHTPEQKGIFDPFRMEQASVVRLIVLFQGELEYKNTDADWRANLKEGAPSIFNS